MDAQQASVPPTTHLESVLHSPCCCGKAVCVAESTVAVSLCVCVVLCCVWVCALNLKTGCMEQLKDSGHALTATGVQRRYTPPPKSVTCCDVTSRPRIVHRSLVP